MIYKRIYFDVAHESAYLDTYVSPYSEIKPRDAILVVPGGGYRIVCSDREGEAVALAYAAKGINAFVLKYTVPPKSKDQPLLEVAGALAYIRKNAKAYGVNPDRVFAVGFSAGAHIVGTLSTKFKKAEELLGLPENFARPTGTIYSYPVVSAMCETHEGSYSSLLGKPFSELTEGEKAEYSNELNVDSSTPPAFIWHTATDNSVPPYGSIRLAESYVRAGVPVEMHLFPCGPHGMALAQYHTSLGREDYIDKRVAQWLDLSVDWMKTVS